MMQEENPASGVPRPKPQKQSAGSLGQGLRVGMGMVGRGLGSLGRATANGWRRLRYRKIPDYVVIALDHAISERAPIVPWWYTYVPWMKLPLSLEYLHTALVRIADDPDVRGVIFLVKGPSLSLTKAQSLAQMFDRFRAWDTAHRDAARSASRAGLPKEIIVHLEDGGAAALVLAAAADRSAMTPLSTWSFAGLRVAPLYLKETLARVGLEFEVARIAPWKSAYENWQRSHMSPESRDQNNWLLDSLFDDIVHTIAQGRNLSPEFVRAQIDRAPLTADEACAAGLIDDILYEDELPVRLASSAQPAPSEQGDQAAGEAVDKVADNGTDEPARLARYANIRGLLYRRARRRHPQAVGVLSLEGSIITGESRRFPVPLPLLGDRLIGSRSVAHQVRAARKSRHLAAVVLHVDSGGGSALASDLIWRELQLLAQEKPLVVYMGDVAASGGYYIATPGRKIVAQRATLTGSIGVVMGKLVTGGATAKLGANREVIQRGTNADIYAEDTTWTPAQRAKLQEELEHIYATFKARVSEGRNLPLDGLDRIAHGRVWTGKQAHAHQLVDAVGDFATALDLACAEADLPQDGSVQTVNIPPARIRRLAEPATPAALLKREGGRETAESWLQVVGAALAGEWESLLGRDRYWFWADGLPRIRE